MIIDLSPQRSDATLLVEKAGDVLTINGEVFDFSVIPEGGVLPAEGVHCELVTRDVRREAGELKLTLILPYAVPSPAVCFPQPIIDPPEGAVVFPTATGE